MSIKFSAKDKIKAKFFLSLGKHSNLIFEKNTRGFPVYLKISL